MNPNEYQKLAARTECDQWAALDRMVSYRPYEDVHTRQLESKLIPVRANHAAIGIAGEAGELAAAIERWIYYGKPLDVINVKEELGDLFWYMAEMCNALQLDMGDIMAANIAKLRKRYPEKYTDELAAEENRDRAAEREVLENGGDVEKFLDRLAANRAFRDKVLQEAIAEGDHVVVCDDVRCINGWNMTFIIRTTTNGSTNEYSLNRATIRQFDFDMSKGIGRMIVTDGHGYHLWEDISPRCKVFRRGEAGSDYTTIYLKQGMTRAEAFKMIKEIDHYAEQE